MKLRRIVSTILTICLLLSVTPAFADNTTLQTMYVTRNTLNIYDSSKLLSQTASLGTIYYGQQVSVDLIDNGWARIKPSVTSGLSQEYVYCEESGISSTDPNNLNDTYYLVDDSTKLYWASGLNTGLDKNTAPGAGKQVTVIAFTPDGDVARVKYDKKFYYVDRNGLSKTKASSEAVYVKEAVVSVYQSQSTKAGVVADVSYGMALTCLRTDGSWSQVSGSKGTGWIQTSALTTIDPNSTDGATYKTNKASVAVYNNLAYTSAADDMLAKDKVVTLLCEVPGGEWYRVAYDSKTGYVKAVYLDDTTNYDNVTAYIKPNSVKAYAAASETSGISATFYFGEKVLCKAINGSYVKITNDWGTGWVNKNVLTTSDNCTAYDEMFAQYTGVKIYGRKKSGTVIATLDKAAKVMRVGSTSDKKYYRVEYQDAFGYVKSSDLAFIAPSTTTLYVKNETANAYSSPSTSSQKLGVFYFGQYEDFTVTNGWASTLYTTQNFEIITVYIKASDLTDKDPTYDPPVKVYCKKTGAKVYEGCSTSSGLACTLIAGDSVDADAITPDKKWLRVQIGSNHYYVQTTNMSLAEPDPGTGTIAKVYAGNTSIKLYANKSTSSKSASAPYGMEFECTQIDGNWAYVKWDYQGLTRGGWCKKSDLLMKNPSVLDEDAKIYYVLTTTATIYQSTSTSGGSIPGSLSQGDKVQVVATTPDGNWMRVVSAYSSQINNDNHGYIKSSAVTLLDQ